jgi:5-methyltetrahydrofolate--homocysteine methyltransferase
MKSTDAKKDSQLQKVAKAVADLNLEHIKDIVKEALSVGVPAYEIVAKGLGKGMEIVGQKYEAHEYFLPELVVAGEVMYAGLDDLKPLLQGKAAESKGVIVAGTVEGDIHDIGKNLFVMLATAAGFEVHDLGNDVSAQKFVQKVKEVKADYVGMSALITTTMDKMKSIIDEIKKAGLRDKVKIIVGGAPMTEAFAKKIGADAFAADALDGVRLCQQWGGAKTKAKPQTPGKKQVPTKKK